MVSVLMGCLDLGGVRGFSGVSLVSIGGLGRV